MIVAETGIRVRYAETDQLGIVYHSNFFPWFEEGRTDYMEKLGFTYADLEKEGLFLPLIDCGCQFLTAAHYADRLIIRTWLDGIKGVRLTMAYEAVRREDGAVLARGTTTHVFVDSAMRAVNIRRLRPDIWQAMKENVRKEQS